MNSHFDNQKELTIYQDIHQAWWVDFHRLGPGAVVGPLISYEAALKYLPDGDLRKKTDQWDKWIAAFQIFKTYGEYAIDAQHDIIYAVPTIGKVSNADKTSLEELGWHIDEHLECFYYFT